MNRHSQIAGFLAEHGFVAVRLLPLAQDASFRRYWRLADGPWPAVLMDAPPPEDLAPFLRAAMHLAGLGLSVPEVRAVDMEHGFLLEEDLGDALFSTTLDDANQAWVMTSEGAYEHPAPRRGKARVVQEELLRTLVPAA